jgi:hypothetical protein
LIDYWHLKSEVLILAKEEVLTFSEFRAHSISIGGALLNSQFPSQNGPRTASSWGMTFHKQTAARPAAPRVLLVSGRSMISIKIKGMKIESDTE